MGGEPLVRRDWDQIAARLRDLGLHVGLVTNGWRLDDQVAQRILDLGICQVGVSLDAASPRAHDSRRGRVGAHDRATRAIRRVAEMPLPYRTVITSVSRGNLPELPAICEWLEANAPGVTWMVNIASCHDSERFGRDELLDEEGFLAVARFVREHRAALKGTLNVTATHDLGYCSSRWTELHDFEWHGCVAGLETLGLRSNGDVTGCLVMDDSFIEGNVLERPLKEIWSAPDAFAYNREFDPSLLEGACRGCEQGALCRGGCRDHAVSFTGSRYDYPFCLHRLERDAPGGEQTP